MFEISNQTLLMHHHTIQVGIDLIYTYEVWWLVEVQSNVGQTTAVIINKAFTVFFSIHNFIILVNYKVPPSRINGKRYRRFSSTWG